MKFNHIISLGADCLPRVSTTKYGIKRSKAQGELSCPFDLAVTNSNDMVKLLVNDFTEYIHPENLYEKTVDGVKIISNRKYQGLFFNHESKFMTSIDFCSNNYEFLIQRYNERIKNFKSYINDNNILFVINCRDHININELKSTLQKIYPFLLFEIVVIHLYECVNVIVDQNDRKIHYLKYYMDDIWNSNDVQLKFVINLVGKFVEYVIKDENSFPIGEKLDLL